MSVQLIDSHVIRMLIALIPMAASPVHATLVTLEMEPSAQVYQYFNKVLVTVHDTTFVSSP